MFILYVVTYRVLNIYNTTKANAYTSNQMVGVIIRLGTRCNSKVGSFFDNIFGKNKSINALTFGTMTPISLSHYCPGSFCNTELLSK